MTLQLIPFPTHAPTQGEETPAGASTPAPRREPCSEIGCDAPATCNVYVMPTDHRNQSFYPVDMPYCAECAQKPGLEIAP